MFKSWNCVCIRVHVCKHKCDGSCVCKYTCVWETRRKPTPALSHFPSQIAGPVCESVTLRPLTSPELTDLARMSGHKSACLCLPNAGITMHASLWPVYNFFSVCVSQRCMCRKQRTTLWSWFSPSTLHGFWVCRAGCQLALQVCLVSLSHPYGPRLLFLYGFWRLNSGPQACKAITMWAIP